MTEDGRLIPFGDSALLIGVADWSVAATLADRLRSDPPPGLVDALGGLGSVVATIDLRKGNLDGLAQSVVTALDQIEACQEPGAPGDRSAGSGLETRGGLTRAPSSEVVLPTVFDGEDLDEVAARCGLSVDDVVDQLCATRLHVAFLGFSVGFAYLTGLTFPLADVPRRPTPRASVAAGSVALAGGFVGVYPMSSPGGWNLVGRTSEVLVDPTKPPYARLQPADRVRLERLEPRSAYTDPSRRRDEREEANDGGAVVRRTRRLDGDATPADMFVVERPGLFTTVQDGGRIGVGHLGVPRGGPADPMSLWVANRLVGNDPDAAGLEITGMGPVLRCVRHGYVGVMGQEGVDGPHVEITLEGRSVPAGSVLPVRPGDRLAVGAAGQGLRAYLSVAGGLGGPAVFGSRSTDVLSGSGPSGPGPLRTGDVLVLDETSSPPALGGFARPFSATMPGGVEPGVRRLRVLPGPHQAWFVANAMAMLDEMTFRVEPTSDRVGVRLQANQSEGLPPLLREGAGQLDSQGMVTGALQVTPDGIVIALLCDHATHGGYPVIGVVTWCDLGILGQCRPGERVRMAVVSRHEAAAANGAFLRALREGVRGHFPRRVD